MLCLPESIVGTIVSGSETSCVIRGLTATILQFFYGMFCCVLQNFYFNRRRQKNRRHKNGGREEATTHVLDNVNRYVWSET